MSLADISIKRPVFAFMMTAALVVMGAVSYRELGLDFMPKTKFAIGLARFVEWLHTKSG